MAGAARPRAKHEVAAAVWTVDFPPTFHVQVDARMAERATAVANHDLRVGFDDFGRLHVTTWFDARLIKHGDLAYAGRLTPVKPYDTHSRAAFNRLAQPGAAL